MGRVTRIEPDQVVLASGLVNMKRIERRTNEVLVLSDLLDRTVTMRDNGERFTVVDAGMETNRNRDWVISRLAVRTPTARLSRRTNAVACSSIAASACICSLRSMTIRVIVPDTGKSYAAKVVGYSVSDDVAVLQLRNASGLTTASLDTSGDLAAGDTIEGPAVIEEFGSTVPVHPCFTLVVDPYGNLVITRTTATTKDAR